MKATKELHTTIASFNGHPTAIKIGGMPIPISGPPSAPRCKRPRGAKTTRERLFERHEKGKQMAEPNKAPLIPWLKEALTEELSVALLTYLAGLFGAIFLAHLLAR